MKIIFLDIDGVVSTHRCQWELDPKNGIDKEDM